MESKYSVVEFLQDNTSSCGYCKSSHSSHSTGMWAYTMTVEDYQDLIDRGWRRSGQYCYKPIQKLTCCPLYTIRCESLNLKLSKSQKKNLKRVGKFLVEGNSSTKKQEGESDSDSASEFEPGCEIFDKHISNVMDQKSNKKIGGLMEVDLSASGDSASKPKEVSAHVETIEDITEKAVKNVPCPSSAECSEKDSPNTPKPGVGRDVSKPQCKKAKLLRLEKKQKKLLEKGLPVASVSKKEQPSEKTLEDLISEYSVESAVNKLELKLVRSFPRSREFEEGFAEELSLYQKYQVTVHHDPISKVSEQQFTRFLVTSPLKPQQKIRGNPSQLPMGYGSFHQHYRLNGKLIAVGVIDILPKCVSSVYFFYDPDYSFLSLGTYGSLREMELVRSLNKQSPELCYYYMGYYIHSCPKMRYKSRYNPSKLLCPEVYTWHPIADCQSKLNNEKYARFNEDPNAICENSIITLNEVLILHNSVAMSYGTYKLRVIGLSESDDDEVRKYGELVGRECAERMLLYR
ncbi:arginyl-tRNA--protein transferase 1 isoform X1 [Halyomorpha halys]|uniref:arginyl-tRNA--protein transferase 1 isoform X1 n=2 Tax=Halyomorpha halys TaxID=286706 RepID=UPI0006D4E4A9|nr:arginyl-tRNA--protein transferase 1 isoform X2 [Halyomorpha halys]